MEIVKKLMIHMDKAEGTVYRDELLSKIILICSQNNYQFITNFEWYITVLVELAQMDFSSKQGHVIGAQLMDVCIRVQAIRAFAVAEMAQLLEVYTSSQQFSILQEVLYAAAWLCGEFASELEKPEETLRAMIKYKTLPPHIEAVFIHNMLKLFAHVYDGYEKRSQLGDVLTLCDEIADKMKESVKSGELEVQERSSSTLVMINVVKEAVVQRLQGGGGDEPLAPDLLILFSGEINPLAPKAQKKVPIPEG